MIFFIFTSPYLTYLTTLVRFCRKRGRSAPQTPHRFPTLVRFCSCKITKKTPHLVKVSIPPWFDFAAARNGGKADNPRVSIPPWFDFAPSSRGRVLLPSSSFNPTLVRFCQVMRAHPERRLVGFNPTLVRFCPTIYGCSDGSAEMFQSHLGSILPPQAATPTAATSGFNPTLVRFCPARALRADRLLHCFNPTLVRFCPALGCRAGIGFLVSIPPWFDFARGSRPRVVKAHLSFNPTLVRFCLQRRS